MAGETAVVYGAVPYSSDSPAPIATTWLLGLWLAAVDAGALARLLGRMPADSRQSHLDMFSQRPAVDSESRVPDVTVLTRIFDPVMQDLLEQVWQRFWATLSDAELAEASGGPPGVEMARRRRAEWRRG